MTIHPHFGRPARDIISREQAWLRQLKAAGCPTEHAEEVLAACVRAQELLEQCERRLRTCRQGDK
jgi:hypothetical protein